MENYNMICFNIFKRCRCNLPFLGSW